MFKTKEDRLWKFGEIKDIIGNKKQYLPIYSDTPYAFQIDLTFFDSAKRLNDGYNILFTAININTRFAYAYYSKDKTAQTIYIKIFIYILFSRLIFLFHSPSESTPYLGPTTLFFQTYKFQIVYYYLLIVREV